MKIVRRLTAMLLAATLALTLLTACGGGGGGKIAANNVDTSVAVKLGAPSYVKSYQSLNEMAKLAFRQAELNAKALSGQDITAEAEQLDKDIDSVANMLMNEKIGFTDMISGCGSTREEAIADMVANYPSAGKDAELCGMAEGEITVSFFGYEATYYYIFVVFGGTAQNWLDWWNQETSIVNVSANNDAYGTVTGAGTYDAESEVTVTATPNAGYKFLYWQESGTTVSTSDSYTFTVLPAELNLVAVFGPERLTVNVSANNDAYGTVTSAYDAESKVTVTATPNAGYRFSCWQINGDTVSTEKTYTFVASEDCTLTAVFEKGYNGNAAAAWGLANYKTSSGACAEFVWKCITKGGGLDGNGVSWETYAHVGSLRTTLRDMGFKEYIPEHNGSKLYKKDNPELSVGDIVMYQYKGGASDGLYAHTAIISDFDSNGEAWIVQRNKPGHYPDAAWYDPYDDSGYSGKNGNVAVTILHYVG